MGSMAASCATVTIYMLDARHSMLTQRLTDHCSVSAPQRHTDIAEESCGYILSIYLIISRYFMLINIIATKRHSSILVHPFIHK